MFDRNILYCGEWSLMNFKKIGIKLISLILLIVLIHLGFTYLFISNQSQQQNTSLAQQKMIDECTTKNTGTKQLADIANCIVGPESQPFDIQLNKLRHTRQYMTLAMLLIYCGLIFCFLTSLYISRQKMQKNLRTSFSLGLLIVGLMLLANMGNEFLILQFYAFFLTLPYNILLLSLQLTVGISLIIFSMLTALMAFKSPST